MNAISKTPNRADTPGEILVVAVDAAVVGKVDVDGHVGGLLRRRPIGEVIADAGVLKSPDALGAKISMHHREFVARGEKPAINSVEPEIRAERGSVLVVLAAGDDVEGVLFACADRRAARARDQLAEARPLRTRALIERRGFEISPTVGGVVRVVVED